MTQPQEATHEVTLTDAAVAKVKSLLEGEEAADLRLRLAVQPGGCSGLVDNPNAQGTCACGDSFD
jgi:Fe-S cluster assembly iron-binding protein IscA